MNCKKAKNINLISYLRNCGFSPKKTNIKEAWFLSPFRKEKTPSFKVDLHKNIWYDFGEGKGGTIIDFVMIFNNCDIKKALEILNTNYFSFHKQQQTKNQATTYTILKVTEIENPNLIDYLKQRKINLQFAKRFCFEVHYSFDGKNNYYGIGFMNNSGGFEIRNKFFKGCLGKKEITSINNNSEVTSIFESWSDFLSYLTLKKEISNENFIILNSTSMIKKAIKLIKNHTTVKTFFDNDEAGKKALHYLKENCKNKILDNRIHYKNHSDLNDYLVKKKKTQFLKR